jgi:hypothetical protein
MGALKIVADVPTTSLVTFRASLLKQVDDTAGSNLSDEQSPVVFSYKSFDGSGEWLILSPSAVKDFASCQKSHKIDIVITYHTPANDSTPVQKLSLLDSMPRNQRSASESNALQRNNELDLMPRNQRSASVSNALQRNNKAESGTVWQTLVSAAEALQNQNRESQSMRDQRIESRQESSVGREDQSESILTLASIFNRANANMQFAFIHVLRWRLSDETILAEILIFFAEKSQFIASACTSDGDINGLDLSSDLGDAFVQLEHASALLEVLSFKGNESQLHIGMRKENAREIVASSFMETGLTLGE